MNRCLAIFFSCTLMLDGVFCCPTSNLGLGDFGLYGSVGSCGCASSNPLLPSLGFVASAGCAAPLGGCAAPLGGCASGLGGCASGLGGCASGLGGCASGLGGCAGSLVGCGCGRSRIGSCGGCCGGVGEFAGPLPIDSRSLCKAAWPCLCKKFLAKKLMLEKDLLATKLLCGCGCCL